MLEKLFETVNGKSKHGGRFLFDFYLSFTFIPYSLSIS